MEHKIVNYVEDRYNESNSENPNNWTVPKSCHLKNIELWYSISMASTTTIYQQKGFHGKKY
jgi:hypothetical protein